MWWLISKCSFQPPAEAAVSIMVVDKNYFKLHETTPFIETLRYCLPFMLPDSRKNVFVAITCVISIIIAKVFHLAMGVFMKLAVDSLSSVDHSVRQKEPLKAAILFLIGRVTVAIATQGFEVTQENYSQFVIRRVTTHAFERLMTQTVNFHINRRVGETIEIVRRGVEAIDIIMRQCAFWLIPTLTEIIYVSVIFWRLGSPSITLVILITVVCHVCYTSKCTTRRGELARCQRDAENSAWAHATERISAHDVVTLFGMAKMEVGKHNNLRLNVQRETYNTKRVVTFYNVSADLILQFGTFVAFVIATRDAANGVLSVGNFTLAITYISALFWPLLVLAQQYGEVIAALANAEQLVELLQTPNEIPDHPCAIPLPTTGTPDNLPLVKFENVSFKHSNGAGVKNISFEVTRGKCVAIVGPSGAGKSTLIRLLMRLNDIQEGSIRVLGINSKHITQTSLRRGISLVPQESTIFSGTLRDNLKYGVDVDDETVLSAIENAALKSWITSLPKGLDTIIGERGIQLSGGERQRIGIVRALLREVPIFLFDEATSALSSIDEEMIQSNIRGMLKGKASIFVAHRLCTIQNADEILVMNQGSVVERGTHVELLQMDGLYARMWDVQSGGKKEK